MRLGENIKILRKRHKKSQEEMSAIFGLTRSSYSGYENGVAEPSFETLKLICAHYKISLDFLANTDFTKLSEADWEKRENGAHLDMRGKALRVLHFAVDEQENDLIEMIPAKARAGYTQGYADPEYLKVLPTFSLPFLSKEKKYRSFPIDGDSMPPVVEGSYVVAEYIQNWMSVKDGTPCIVVTKEDGIVFKLVTNQLAKEQSLILSSTNVLYKPYTIHANEIIELWKFVNYISPELPDVRMDDEQLKQSISALQQEVHALRKSMEK